MATFSLVTATASAFNSISMDGQTWSGAAVFPGVGAGSILCVQWSPALGLFVALGSGGAGITNCFTSPDGVTWTLQPGPSVDHWNAIAWSPDLKIFCAISAQSAVATSQDVATSSDGKNWTTTAGMPSSAFWRSICWSSALGIFVAVGNNVVATSPDGVTWTAQTIAAGTWSTVIWAPALNLFLAKLNGTTYATSTNGVTWNTSTLPASGSAVIGSAVWSPSLGIFCIVCSTAVALTSPDGVTWTTQTTPSALNVVQRSEALGIFVGIGSAGVAASSPDGVTWTARTVPNQSWAQPAINDSPSVAPMSSVPRFVEEPGWVGKSLSASIALLALSAVAKPFATPAFSSYRNEEAGWQGHPVHSSTIPFLTAQRFFGAGGQAPTKGWRHDHDNSTYWVGQPLDAQIIQNLTIQKFFGAGGQVPAKKWRYDYETLPQWQGQPTDAQALQNLSFAPTSPTKRWRWDHDGSTAYFQFFHQSNFPLLGLVSTVPAIPLLWKYNYDVNITAWAWRPPTCSLLHPAGNIGKAPQKVWRYDYGFEALWLGKPLASPQKPTRPFTARTTQGVDEVRAWQSRSVANLPLLMPLLKTTPFPSLAWHYDYAVEAVWQGKPIQISTIFVEIKPLTDPRFITLAHPRIRFTREIRVESTKVARTFVTISRNGMPQGNDFSVIDNTEIVTGTFDMGPWLQFGQAIASVESVTCAVNYGTDADAATRLVGAPSIGPSPFTGTADAAVLQQWGNMLPGVTYLLVATVLLNDGQQLTLWAHQSCQQAT